LKGNSSDSVGSRTGTDIVVTYSSAVIGEGAVFSGISGIYFDTPWTPTATYSIGTWVNSSDSSSVIWSITDVTHTSSSGDNISLKWSGTGFVLGGGTTISTGGDFADSSWHYVLVTVDSTFATLYVDGVSTASGTIDNLLDYPSDIYLRLGVSSTGGSNMTGSLDEVGLWTRTLTSDEDTSLYNSGSGFSYPFSGGVTPPPPPTVFPPVENFVVATSTTACIMTNEPDSTTTYACFATSTIPALLVKDGYGTSFSDLAFACAIMITLLFLVSIGMFYNAISLKKR
jgi:hypothetical protein